MRGCRGRDHMVVGFTTTYAISAYHHWSCEFESRSGWGVQHYVIKFVSDLWQVGCFLWSPQVSSTNKTDCHDITEILLKVALNTIKQNKQQNCKVRNNDIYIRIFRYFYFIFNLYSYFKNWINNVWHTCANFVCLWNLQNFRKRKFFTQTFRAFRFPGLFKVSVCR